MMKLITRAGFTTALVGLLLATPAFAQTVTRTANFSQGDTITVATKVNVRSAPNGVIVGQQVAGATGSLVGGPVNKNGYTWWNVDYVTGVDGWTAEDFMQNATSAMNTSQTSTLDQKISALRAQLNALLAEISTMSQTAAAAGSQQ